MNLRANVRKANLKKWMAQGPAVIERPVRLITRRLDRSSIPDKNFMEAAYFAANRGNGALVREMARKVLSQS